MSGVVRASVGRNCALDAWRGGLLMVVLWYHAGPLPVEERGRFVPFAWAHDAVRQVGWATMDCFFAMSGFLVGGLLFAAYRKTGDLGVWRFYARRGMKIYPAFYLLWVLTVLFGERIGVTVTAERAAVEGLFVQNFWRGLWVHTWSLGVEEQFYLLLPVVLWVGLNLKSQISNVRSRQGGAGTRPGAGGEIATAQVAAQSLRQPVARGRDAFAWVPWMYVATLAGVVAARVWTVVQVPGWDIYRHFSPSWLRMDEPMIGVVCAWWYHFRRESLVRCVRRWCWVFVLVGAVGLGAPVVWTIESRWTILVGYTAVAAGFSAWMMLMVVRPWMREGEERGSWWWVRALAFVGVHSYSIYVFHQPVRWVGAALIKQFGGREATWWELGALVFPVAVVVGIVLARVIEMPVLVLRDRVVPSRSGGAIEMANSK